MCYHIIVVNVFMFTLLSDFFLRFLPFQFLKGKAEAFRFSAKGFVFYGAQRSAVKELFRK